MTSSNEITDFLVRASQNNQLNPSEELNKLTLIFSSCTGIFLVRASENNQLNQTHQIN